MRLVEEGRDFLEFHPSGCEPLIRVSGILYFRRFGMFEVNKDGLHFLFHPTDGVCTFSPILAVSNETVDSLCRSVSKTVPSEKLPSSAQTGCPESLD
jgi:hypothetical protein